MREIREGEAPQVLVVDIGILVDMGDADPELGAASARCLSEHLKGGPVGSPISHVALATIFVGATSRLDEFLDGLGVARDAILDLADRRAAFAAWDPTSGTRAS